MIRFFTDHSHFASDAYWLGDLDERSSNEYERLLLSLVRVVDKQRLGRPEVKVVKHNDTVSWNCFPERRAWAVVVHKYVLVFDSMELGSPKDLEVEQDTNLPDWPGSLVSR